MPVLISAWKLIFYIFRIVHWQNVEHILTNGLCCRAHPDYDPNYINIGHQQLIEDRHSHPVPLAGYGNLGDYIPFYFWGHSPMLYMIMHGFKGVKQYPQEEIVYIVVNSMRVIADGLKYVFTDRHAKRRVAKFFTNPNDFDKLRWDIIRSKDWKDTEEDMQRMDFKQAEFLVRNHLSTAYIDGIFVKNETKKIEIENIIFNLGLHIPVSVAREGKLYY